MWEQYGVEGKHFCSNLLRSLTKHYAILQFKSR